MAVQPHQTGQSPAAGGVSRINQPLSPSQPGGHSQQGGHGHQGAQAQSGGGASSTSMQDVKQAAQQAGDRMKDKAQETAADLRSAGQDFISDQKSRAANGLNSFSTAIRSAAEKLREEDNSPAARYAEMAADRIEGVARYIGDQDLGSMLSEVERAARRRPELFLGGMFLVGLGISRFLKASRSDDSSSHVSSPRTFSRGPSSPMPSSPMASSQTLPSSRRTV